jgi:hypothetical protein
MFSFLFCSHIHNGRYEVLDHILVSQEFVRSNPNHIGYVQFLQLFNDHLVDETLTEEKRDNIASDHGQVVVQLKIYPKDQPYHRREGEFGEVFDSSTQQQTTTPTTPLTDTKHASPQQQWVKKGQ